MSRLLGIDVGTTETKVGLFSDDGTCYALARSRYALDSRQPGWAEQDAEAWWEAIVRGVREVLAADRAGRQQEVVAVSVAGQGPTLVVADEAGVALRPAITWMDRRAASVQVELEERLGLPGWKIGELARVAWLQRHEPAVYERARWFLTSWDYVAFRLAGVAASSVSGDGRPTQEMATAAGIDGTRLPDIVPVCTPLGGLLPEAAAPLGLEPGVLVVAGGNDALASFFGAGLLTSGQAIDTGGTSGGFAVFTDRRVEVPGAWAGPAPIPGLWLYGGAMSATGKSLDWLAGTILQGAVSAEALLAEASAIAPGAEGLVFLPYLAGERSPIWDDGARGTFVGLTLTHQRAHLARAVMEGAAMAIRHVAEPILAAGIEVNEMRVCGGPARSDAWNQVKADVTGFPVAVPAVLETASLGAAILAAAGVGMVPDPVEGSRRMTRVRRVVEPRPRAREVYDRLYRVYRSLYPPLAPLFHELAEVTAAGAALESSGEMAAKAGGEDVR